MNHAAPSYHGYRFPPPIISHAVWLYHRFCLSFRDAEDLLAQRGITVSYKTIRQWCLTLRARTARIYGDGEAVTPTGLRATSMKPSSSRYRNSYSPG